MPDIELNEDGTPKTNEDPKDKGSKIVPPDVEKIVQEKVEESLKEIKSKLDNAYSARDDAVKKVKAFEAEKREAELKRLEEEGKHREAYEQRLAEANAAREAAEKRNIELTRDLELKGVLADLPFRNEKSREMAFREVVDQLVQTENKLWVHKTGVSIRDFIKTFSSNEENAFLFKAKASSGTGSGGNNKPTTVSGENKSLFLMSQEEVLTLAAEGKLPKRQP